MDTLRAALAGEGGAPQDESLSLFFILFRAYLRDSCLTSLLYYLTPTFSAPLLPPNLYAVVCTFLSPTVHRPWGPIIMTDIHGCNGSSSSARRKQHDIEHKRMSKGVKERW